MQKNKLSALLVVCSVVVVLAGCRQEKQPIVESQSPPISAESEQASIPTEEATHADIPPTENFLQESLALGMKAAQLAKFSQDSADWKIVHTTWLESIKKLESIPAESKDYEVAQKKILEYKTNANIALKKSEDLDPQQIASSNVTPQKTQEKQTQANTQASKKPEETTDFGRQLLDTWITKVTKEGDAGTRYWCSQYAHLQSSLFAPRSVEILKYDKTTTDRPYARLRITSSNRGGQTIVSDWIFVMAKEEDPERAKLFPGGLCIATINER